jgi:hypothetical protein
MVKYLYHCSSNDVGDKLRCHPSRVVGNESVVFAGKTRAFALVFAVKWIDADLEYGCFGKGTPFILREQYPGAFDRFHTSGWVYKVDAKYFKSDPRTGMREEFVSWTDVPVVKKEFIPDVWKELGKYSSSLILMKFDTYSKLMYKYASTH